MKRYLLLGVLIWSATSVAANEKFLCDEKWGHAVFYDTNPQRWRDTALVPKGQYLIESEKDGARVLFVGRKNLSNDYNCDRFLGGITKCLNSTFVFQKSKMQFTYWHDHGEFYSFVAGSCQKI